MFGFEATKLLKALLSSVSVTSESEPIKIYMFLWPHTQGRECFYNFLLQKIQSYEKVEKQNNFRYSILFYKLS